MRKFALFVMACLWASLLSAQTAQYPGAVVSDSHLKVARNRVSTTLRSSITAAATSIEVSSATNIVANMLLTIDSEIVSVTSLTGTTLTVVRGFDGTTAVAHSAGRVVSCFWTAWDKNVLNAEVRAIQMALGPSLSNVSAIPGVFPATSYDFAAQAPGGSLTAATPATVTLTPCPFGMNGADPTHYLYVSGGIGTAEAVLITGGTCTSGAATGTVTFTPANNHTFAWTIQSATDGVQEAVCVLPTAGGDVAMLSNVTLYANVAACGKTAPSVVKSTGVTITGAFTVLGSSMISAGHSERYGAEAAWPTMDAGGQVYNVKAYGADSTGVADSTTAIRAALTAGAGKIVYFPPGTFKVSDVSTVGYGLKPAIATHIQCAGSTDSSGIHYAATTTINYTDTDTPLILIQDDTTTVENCKFVYAGATAAVAGSTAIKTENNGTTTAASGVNLRDLHIEGFYYGLDIDSTDHGNLDRIMVHSCLSHGIVARAAQGFWDGVTLVGNLGHGVYVTAGTLGKTSPISMVGLHTYSNGGWGLYSDYRLESVDDFYINNDSLGGIYIGGGVANSAIIGKGKIEGTGLNDFTAKTVTGASVVSPVRITTSAPHGWLTGKSVTCGGVAGVAAANVTANITVFDATHFDLDGTVGAGGYTGGGKCGPATGNFIFDATAPGIKIAATATNVSIDGVRFFGTNGNAIDSAAPYTSIVNVDVTGPGVALNASNTYAVKLTGTQSSVGYGSHLTGPSYFGASYLVISGVRVENAHTLPAMYFSAGAANTTLEGNFIYSAASNAVTAEAAATFAPGSNVIQGTLTETNTSSIGIWTGIFTTYAAMAAGQTSFGYCKDCKVTSTASNVCVAAGTGAWFFYEYGTTTFRCFQNTVTAASSATSVCTTYTVLSTNAAFIAAATAVSVTLGALPARGKVTGANIKHSVQYSDGAGAMTEVGVSVGDGSTHTAYSASQNIGEATAVADTTFTDTPQFKSTTMAASNLVARFTATGANFGTGAATSLLTGTVAIVVCAVTLP